jgi:hypothetical protein
VLVLVLAMILTAVGLAAVAVSRIGGRSMDEGREWQEARGLAFSAVEHALGQINATSNWRTAFSGQTVQKSLGHGTFTWRVVDEADGNLTNDPTQPFTVLATGTVQNATYTMRVHVTVGSLVDKGIIAQGAVSLQSSSVDSYDSGLGAYGGTNVGSSAAVGTNTTAAGGVSLTSSSTIKGSVKVGPGGDPNIVISTPGGTITGTRTAMSQAMTMPTPAAPSIGASTGDLNTGVGNTITISGNRHVNNLTADNGSTIQTSGNVIILVDGAVTIRQNARIRVLEGSSLKLFFKNTFTVDNNAIASVVEGPNMSRLQIVGLGASAVTMVGNAMLQGVIIAPTADMSMGSNARVLGAVVAKSISMSSNAAIHEDKRITSGTDPVSCGPGRLRPDAWSQVVQ